MCTVVLSTVSAKVCSMGHSTEGIIIMLSTCLPELSLRLIEVGTATTLKTLKIEVNINDYHVAWYNYNTVIFLLHYNKLRYCES